MPSKSDKLASTSGLQLGFISGLQVFLKSKPWYFDTESTWRLVPFLRACIVRLENGDSQAWSDFVTQCVVDDKHLKAVRMFFDDRLPSVNFDDLVILKTCLEALGRGDEAAWERFAIKCSDDSYFCRGRNQLADLAQCPIEQIAPSDLGDLLSIVEPNSDPFPPPSKKTASQVMYIERKAGNLTGTARIGRVTLSKSGKTIYYQGRRYQSTKGGYKHNYLELESGEDYWISRPRRDGGDRLYGGRSPIGIDEDAREEYWTDIRRKPENIDKKFA